MEAQKKARKLEEARRKKAGLPPLDNLREEDYHSEMSKRESGIVKVTINDNEDDED